MTQCYPDLAFNPPCTNNTTVNGTQLGRYLDDAEKTLLEEEEAEWEEGNWNEVKEQKAQDIRRELDLMGTRECNCFDAVYSGISLLNAFVSQHRIRCGRCTTWV